MAFGSTIPRSFTRDFHFDLPDGVSYTPNTLPSKSIRLSSPDLPARETANPSSARLDFPFRSIFSDTAPLLFHSPARFAAIASPQPSGPGRAQIRRIII